jgi:predicted dehydrogenase
MTSPNTRRDFLKQTALTGIGFWVAGGLTSSLAKQPGPNERINVAVIGAGGRGRADLNAVAQSENIVALCDVDDVRAAESYRRFPKVPVYHDFRVMLEKQKNIDAVVVATPDHMHALASITAMRMGKHCYTEKPLCHSIWECRQMKETAQKNKVQTQMGNQHTADNEFRRAVEIVQSGALGEVREVHAWTDRPIWPQNLARPKDTPAAPKTLDWQLWLGPAPERPYNGAYVPHNWRGWWDFGTGALGDMGCHTMNMPFMALRLGYPTAVTAEVDTALNNETAPLGCKVTYEFPARGKLPPVRMFWYERRRPDEKLLHGLKFVASGAVLVGSQGSLYSRAEYGGDLRLLPEQNFQNFKDPNPTLPRVNGRHHREWLDAIRGGRAPMSNFVDYAALLAEVVLLGNVAIRVGGKRVVWNAEKMHAVDLPAADAFIRREYRKGWAL